MAHHPGMRSIRRPAPSGGRAEGEICVVGSGAAGLSAALEARALGRRVVLVDASGDAVVPWLAGAELHEADRPIYGTTMAIFDGVDTDACAGFPRERYHEAMRRRGHEFGIVRHDGLVFPMAEPGKVLLNQTHVEIPRDAVGQSRAGIEGRRQVDGLLELFRQEFPEAYANARVALYGQPGIRQTRTIQGRSRKTPMTPPPQIPR